MVLKKINRIIYEYKFFISQKIINLQSCNFGRVASRDKARDRQHQNKGRVASRDKARDKQHQNKGRVAQLDRAFAF